VITSIRNPRVQAARRLHRRAGRDEAGRFLIEGRRITEEALSSPLNVEEVFVVDDLDGADELMALAKSKGVELLTATDGVMNALSQTTTPQGIVGVAEIPTSDLAEVTGDLVVVLDEVADPGNAGTITRSALGAGAGSVIFGAGSVDPWNAKTVRAAAGASFRIPIVSELPIREVAAGLKEKGFKLVGTASGAPPIYDADLSQRVALFFGNEAWGLPAGHADLLDETVGIPMAGPLESLNVSIAASVIMFEALRQRDRYPPRPHE
jgi:RNA methyltransferase, TrmH family